MSNSSYAFILSVGPNEKDMCLDTLNSAHFYHPDADFFILDDCTQDGTYEALLAWAQDKPATVLRNPYPFKYAGMCKNISVLMMYAVNAPKAYDFVVKIDTDTLFIAPGVEHVIAQRFEQYGPGIVGDFRYGGDRQPRSFKAHVSRLWRDAAPLDFQKSTGQFRIGPACYFKWFVKALQNNYQVGEHIFGALYAFHTETYHQFYHEGLLHALYHSQEFRRTTSQEDVLFSMAARAIGHPLIELNPIDEAVHTWLEYGQSVTKPLAFLANNHFKVLHPLKKDAAAWEIRNYFAAQRQAEKATCSLSV